MSHNCISLKRIGWRISIVFPIVATAWLLTNCSPRSSSRAKGKSTIRFLAAEYSTATAPYWDRIKADFQKANPDVDLVIDVVKWDQMHAKLTAMVGANQPPDIANIATTWLMGYVDNDVLEPLDGYMSKDFINKFVPLTLQGARARGKTYGLPIAVSARALYCNKTILDNARQRPPATWEELLKVAQTVNRPSKTDGFGIECTSDEGHAYFAYFLWAAGGEFFDAKGKCVVNSPAGVEALQFLVDLVRKHHVATPQPTAKTRDEMQKVFEQGGVAMMITGPWFWGMLQREAPEVKYSISLIPAHKKQVTMAVTDNLILFRSYGSFGPKAGNDAATQINRTWKFIEFLYNDKYRREFDEAEGMLPELKFVAEQLKKKSPEWKTFIELLPTGKFLPNHPKMEQIFLALVKEMQLAYLGEKTPREALDDAATKINTEILKQ